ncbi:unnamed protein product [Prunus armeniaca]|uniref:Uncharacterized protein n=1 Tax=Prunus armeniaca TaxID=36596 RepID=A0A6J5WJ72_PRUAR|nr:unnamed protein product [Prunus armeniaca]
MSGKWGSTTVVDNDLSQDESQLSIISVDPKSLETSKQHELALTPVILSPFGLRDLSEVSALVHKGASWRKKVLPGKSQRDDSALEDRLFRP